MTTRVDTPFTSEELFGIVTPEGQFDVEVLVDFDLILENDFEGFLDILSGAIVSDGIIEDIDYTLTGVEDGCVIINVIANLVEDN